MLVSFIISTYNRREVLLDTLEQIRTLGLSRSTYEIHVVDNASIDGTADAVAALPGVRLYRESINRGSCAKNIALQHAIGEYLVLLDDDSYPRPGSIERMIRHFEACPNLGAATFTVTLPDGSQECSAFPNVFIGCGVGLRRGAIEAVGGLRKALPDDFFMQAEEYDLSLRLLDAGYEVRAFEDMHVAHLKTARARVPARVMRLDVRNNLMLIGRYFPDDRALVFCIDWMRRYWMIACASRQRRAFALGMMQGAMKILRRGRRPVTDAAFEQFARIEQIKRQMMLARCQYRARNVLMVDLGKNILPYWLAARACGFRVVAIADNRLAGRRYRGIPIVSDERAAGLAFDIAIISNSSPVHAKARAQRWRSIDLRPVIDPLAIPPEQSLSAAA